MEVEVATVFVGFQVIIPFPETRKERNAPYDLLQLALTLWNTEVVRNARGEILHCAMRFPPLTYRGVLYSGPVLTIRPSGIAELVGSGSVEASVAFAHRARALVLDAARRCPSRQAPVAASRRQGQRHPLLDQCFLSASTSTQAEAAPDEVPTLCEERYLEERRLVAALRGESTQLSLFNRSNTLLEKTPVGGDAVPLLEATQPTVSFFNAIVRPDVAELIELQRRLGLHQRHEGAVPYGVRRRPRASLNVTGDTTVDWLHRFLGPTAHATTAAVQTTREPDEDTLSPKMRAYVTPKQAHLRRILVSFSARRFERQAGIQLILSFSSHKPLADSPGHKRPRATEGAALTENSAVLPSVLPTTTNLQSVDFFFADSVAPAHTPPPTTTTPGQGLPNVMTPPAAAAGSLWEETIKCSLFSTGKVQASAKSERGLELAIRLVLLPLLVCCADIQ